jgi:hypothetical protein
VIEELCASSESRGGTCGAADDSIRILRKSESQDPEFQKKYPKLVGEEPTPVIPNEIEKLISELPRDGHGFSKESATNV